VFEAGHASAIVLDARTFSPYMTRFTTQVAFHLGTPFLGRLFAL
jgi:hypothetical protein